ncbi:three-Cys-motif partner protein TcmP [Streptomyces aidingensis]|uniref:Three-Cys-motif partner protein n=1 Tax=Streptomyces aidingensis TaxID=910347 RepID=A0A1I1UVP7_9ACTN|nr:three-Cys-motif partner protein TcmP [Streptomyces aidingensis]SFD74892.1 three-Cys-motif partner protein [Streptomyces aidingensis]
MAKGTSGGYWDEQNLPSRFKHELLRHYIPPFGGMTGSRDKQVVYLDGYAGEGRYDSGEPGSAEIAMKVAADHLRHGLRWTCFFIEKGTASVARLRQVAGEYQRQGVDARVHHSDVTALLAEVTAAAVGQPLFLFLDPCGLTLPFDELVRVLADQRRPGAGNWPPTELLMNFSMMAVRRLGGNARSERGLEASSVRFDGVCGGPWWREYFVGGLPPEDAAGRVADGYAQRLSAATGMHVVSVPVARAPGHKPVYHLVFATRSQYGLWVFGDSAARAKEAWWEKVELTEEAADDALFTMASVIRPDPEEVRRAAVPAIAQNLGRLLKRVGEFRLVDHTVEVFGDFYGQVTEPAARKAVKHLHKEGGTPTTGVGSMKTRELVVLPPADSR